MRFGEPADEAHLADPRARGGLSDELGVLEQWVAMMNDYTKTAIRDGLGEAGYARATEESRVLTLGEAVALALSRTDVNLLSRDGDSRWSGDLETEDAGTHTQVQ